MMSKLQEDPGGSAVGHAGDNVLVASGLTMRFGGFAAVNNVDLSIRRGSIHALIGPNGAGKTTCFNLLTKTLKPTAGTIVYDGHDITPMRTADVARMGLVRSFQISATFPHMTALENVRVALQSNYGSQFRFWNSLRRIEPLKARAMELLEQVGLADLAHVDAADLSYGKKRALEIATTLALEPKIMLLDEPTAGMGREDIEPITELIRETAKGRTVLIVEHNLSIVATLCDRITVLQNGAVLTEGSYAEVSSDERVITAYMGGVDED
jgi:branched-chain amino acid transport system ATP-binding protein